MERKLAFIVVLVLIFASTEKVKSREAPSPVAGDDYEDPWNQFCESLKCETNANCKMCSGHCVNSHCSG
ncbi:hypothetical protein ACP275_07G073900 [Erythranthe tilingii]